MKFHLREFHDRNIIELFFEEPPDKFQFDSDEIYGFQSPVKFTGKAEKVGSKVIVSGVIETKVTALCSRCVDEFEIDLTLKFTFLYLKKKGNLEIDDSQEAYYSAEEINLNPEIHDFIILNLSVKPLCRTDCKGICPDCGVNLNKSKCCCGREKAAEKKVIKETGTNLGKIIKQTLQGGK